MDQADAMTCVARLEAGWDEFPDSRKAVYAEHLMGYEVADAVVALRWLERDCIFRPRIREMCDVIEEARRLRQEAEVMLNRKALGAGGELSDEEQAANREIARKHLRGFLDRAREASAPATPPPSRGGEKARPLSKPEQEAVEAARREQMAALEAAMTPAEREALRNPPVEAEA